MTGSQLFFLLMGVFVGGVAIIWAIDSLFLKVVTADFRIVGVWHVPSEFDAAATAMQYGGPHMGDLYTYEAFQWKVIRNGETYFLEVDQDSYQRHREGDTVTLRYGVRRLTKQLVFQGVDRPLLA